MAREIMISVSPGETRIAKFEEGRLTDLAYERERFKDDVALGDIVLGRVTRVDPSINLAFIDVGTSRNAVLLGYDAEPLGPRQDTRDERGRRPRPRIERLVDEGQSLVLTVVSEAVDNKGAKLSAKITLPGQHLVFITYRDEIVFSRQIEDQEERTRLGDALESAMPEKGGFILRTSAVGIEAEALREEAQGLADKWADLEAQAKATDGPAVLLKEEAGPIRALRDHLGGTVNKILIDDGDLVATARQYAKEHRPELLDCIEHYTGEAPLFEEYEIEADIERLMSPRVPLKGGGWIIIEETEALIAIDVNSGRRRVHGGKEAMALDTNMAAVKEIAKQVRLRGLGGAFVIDLIQMREENNMIKVEDMLEAAMKGDPLPHKVGEISDFGLLEMTRKRTSKPLSRALMERCAPCEGRGQRLNVETVALGLVRRALEERPAETFTLVANDEVAAWLEGLGAAYVAEVKSRLGVDILIEARSDWPREQIHIIKAENSIPQEEPEDEPEDDAEDQEVTEDTASGESEGDNEDVTDDADGSDEAEDNGAEEEPEEGNDDAEDEDAEEDGKN